MKNQVIVISEETNLQQLPESKAAAIRAVFDPMTKMIDEMEGVYNEVIANSKEGIDGAVMKDARELRITIAKIRIDAEKKRKELKSEYLIAGKAIDGVNNILKYAIQGKEKALSDIEKHFEILEEEKRQQLQKERAEILAPFVDDPHAIDLTQMEEKVFEAFVDAARKTRQAEIQAEIDTEKEAERKEQELIEFERENKRLKDKLKKQEAERQKEIVFMQKELDIEKERASLAEQLKEDKDIMLASNIGRQPDSDKERFDQMIKDIETVKESYELDMFNTEKGRKTMYNVNSLFIKVIKYINDNK